MNVRRLTASAALALVIAAAFAVRAAAQDPAPGADEHGFFPVKADPPYDLDSTGQYGGTLIWSEIETRARKSSLFRCVRWMQTRPEPGLAFRCLSHCAAAFLDATRAAGPSWSARSTLAAQSR